ncbi:MAG: hypothetical protein QOF36_1622 [Microbacteriaceae bacterium]|nr:hypothetical protein [Microbacteriaceae bacterium]
MQSRGNSRNTLTRRQATGAVSYLFVGAGSAIVGLVPWLITGMRLPLQNLWAVATPPNQMPITLLPFSQYALTLIVAVIVTGSAVAGGFARARRGHYPRFGVIAIAIGVLIVQMIATVQTAVTVSGGLSRSTVSSAYLAALIAGTVTAILIGLLVLVLIARARAAAAAVALSIAAIALGVWVNGLVIPFGTLAPESTTALLSIVRWVPAIIVGLALAWCGLSSVGRVAAAIVSFLVLWIGPALFTATSVAAGTRVMAPHPDEMVQFGMQVFVSALGIPGGSLSLLILALVVMVLGLAVRWAIRRRRPERAATA